MVVLSDEEIHKRLRDYLKPSRYLHSLGVAYTAVSLAMRYGETNLHPFLLAGLLHDCARYMDGEEALSFCREHQIEITKAEQVMPMLLHGKIGSVIAREEYGVCQKEVLSAIYWHVSSKPAMSFLEKSIIIADFLEPGRTHLCSPSLEELRKLAFDDMDLTVYYILKAIKKHVNSNGYEIEPIAEEALTFYQKGRDTDYEG